MVLHHAHRTALHQGLREFVPEEAVDEMLSHFPTREGEEPVMKEFLHAELAGVRTELRTGLADVRTELRTGLADVRTEMRTGLADVRTEMADVRTEMRTGLADVRTDMADVRTEMVSLAHRQTRWMVSTIVATAGVLAALRFFG